MILTDYYKFVKLEGQKSRMRIDCTASTRSYDTLERYRDKKGLLKLYIGDIRFVAVIQRPHQQHICPGCETALLVRGFPQYG